MNFPRLFLLTMILVLLASCQKQKSESYETTVMSVDSITKTPAAADYESPKDIINWKSDADTLTYGKWVITFSKTDSVFIPDYFPEQQVFDSAYNKNHNYFEGVQGLEQYLLTTDQKNFRVTDSLELFLLNGKTKRFNRWNGEYGYSFLSKLKDLDYFLLHIQYYEGSSNELVNIKSGASTYTKDLPYFNPNQAMIASLSADVFRNYDDNGIEILLPDGQVFKRALFIDTGGWTPDQCIWISANELVVKRKFYKFIEIPEELWNKTNYVKITFHEVN